MRTKRIKVLVQNLLPEVQAFIYRVHINWCYNSDFPPAPWQEQPDTLHLEVTPSKWLTSACGNPLCLLWSFVQTAFPHREGWGQSPDPSFQAHYLPCKLPAEKQTEVPPLVMCQPWTSLGLSLPLLLKSTGDIINQTGMRLDTFSDSLRDLMQGLKQKVAMPHPPKLHRDSVLKKT